MNDTTDNMGIVFGKTGVAEPAFERLLIRSSTAIPYEIRRYGVRYAIETEFPKGRESLGFRALAGYIGVGTVPQNEGSVSVAMTAPVVTEDSDKGGKQIAMTAPVVTSSSESGGKSIAMTAPVVMSGDTQMKKMQFILPAEYDDMAKIPKPTNRNVILKEVPAATGAVHKFSGFVNDEKSKEKARDLANQLKEDGVDVTEEDVLKNYELWQHHPPFTLGPLRRNEIWVNLTQKQVDELLKKYKEDLV